MSVTSKLGLLILCAAAFGACGEGVLPEQQDMVWFTAVETDLPEPETIVDPGPSMSKAQISSYEPIVNGFLINHERLLERTDIRAQIERIENIFLALGRYHEIVAIFRADVNKKGMQSHVADRLAWAYVRLGQRKMARDLIDKLLAARPDDPSVHFMDGAYWIQASDRSATDLQKAARGWRRVVELDPNFVGPEGLTAAVLRDEVAKFEREAQITAAADPTAMDLAQAIVDDVAAPEAPGNVEDSAPTDEGAGDGKVDEPAAPEIEAPVEAAPAPEPLQQRTNKEEYRLLVAKGQIALSGGNPAEAERLFRAAKLLEPNGFDAEFGRLQAGWSQESARNKVATGMRTLAQRTDLSARQKYDLAVFLWSKMTRADLAEKLLQAVIQEDPDLATRLDVPGLLARMKSP